MYDIKAYLYDSLYQHNIRAHLKYLRCLQVVLLIEVFDNQLEVPPPAPVVCAPINISIVSSSFDSITLGPIIAS